MNRGDFCFDHSMCRACSQRQVTRFMHCWLRTLVPSLCGSSLLCPQPARALSATPPCYSPICEPRKKNVRLRVGTSRINASQYHAPPLLASQVAVCRENDMCHCTIQPERERLFRSKRRACRRDSKAHPERQDMKSSHITRSGCCPSRSIKWTTSVARAACLSPGAPGFGWRMAWSLHSVFVCLTGLLGVYLETHYFSYVFIRCHPLLL